LSRGGAFLATNELLPVDEKVQLVVSLPWEIGTIRAEARVVWRSDMMFDTDRELTPGVGLEYTHMSLEDADRLEAFMQKFNRLADQINEED
jgi:Tfp pilus assembly protein PilZ